MKIIKVTNNIFDIFWGEDDFLPWEWTRIKMNRSKKSLDYYKINGVTLPPLAKAFVNQYFGE